MNTINEEFRRGAKAMFNYLLIRAANNYHGNPSVQKQCNYDNALVKDWAEDALESVSPDDATEWRSVSDAYNSGYKLGRSEPKDNMTLYDLNIAEAWVASKNEIVDCKTCANRGVIYKLSEESSCDHCKWQEQGRIDLYCPNVE